MFLSMLLIHLYDHNYNSNLDEKFAEIGGSSAGLLHYSALKPSAAT